MKSLFAGVLFFCLPVISSGQTTAEFADRAEAYARRSNSARDAAMADSALAMADQALRIDSNNARAHFIRGSILANRGRPNEAADAYLAAYRAQPGYPLADRQAVGQLWRAGRHSEGYLLGRQIADKYKDDLTYLFAFGVTCGFLLELECAESAFRHGNEVSATWVFGYGELAFLAAGRRDYQAAVRFMEASLARDSLSQFSVGGLAHMHILAGNPQRAVDILNPALQRLPDGTGYGGRGFRTLLGWAYWQLGDTAQANIHFEHRLQQLASRERAGESGLRLFRERAAIHAVRGNRDEALRDSRRAFDAGWRLYGATSLEDPMFSRIADDPEFRALSAAMQSDIDAQRVAAGLRRIEFPR